MKLLLFLLAVIALLGCATPTDRRKYPPDIVTSSKKSAKEVAICIAEKWENTKPFMGLSSPPVNTNLKLDGYSITATDTNIVGSTTTFALADVTENQLGSTTKYYKMGVGFGDYDQVVKECQ